ncbi:MAG: glycerophosphodiester phosphodiesterase family protein [Prevotellaceae bacterium]|jgi:glycerophosphoryl diester phosphodiesterase|nr:glycerophosphodiester phosphodiesterase family protein [Prevotellaceae bacterium]
MKKISQWRRFFAMASLLFSVLPSSAAAPHYIDLSSPGASQQHFAYTGNGAALVSGHRGGREAGFSENSLEGLANVLEHMPAFFEIDPRLTKDSVMVLLHDATLERTTTGKGKLSDYTWAELQSVRLKDSEGNVTPYKIPLLEEVIRWSKGKTIVNLDKKDVPLPMIAALIERLGASEYVMLTVHTGAQARYYHDRFPNIMLSAFSRNAKEYEDLEICGVTWRNMIAYVGATIDEKNRAIVEKLRAHGVRVMISVAPTHDKLTDKAARMKEYKKELAKKPDVVESDIPTEIWEAMQQIDN